jgi:asparagine synthase (glutamine-hydrolysing)
MAPVEPRAMGNYFEEPLSSEELYEEAIAVWNASTQPDLCSRTLEFFTSLYLQNNIMTKVDRASMSVSLESRAVFLDSALVDFCRRLPNSWKLRNGTRKYLLRRAIAGMVPPQVLTRRKRGFAVPLAQWLHRIPFPEHRPEVDGLKVDAFRRAWHMHQRQEGDERLLLWAWLSLSSWAGQIDHLAEAV